MLGCGVGARWLLLLACSSGLGSAAAALALRRRRRRRDGSAGSDSAVKTKAHKRDEELVANVISGHPCWIPAPKGGGCRLWYKANRGHGKHAFVLAEQDDASGSARCRPLFDHTALAKALAVQREANGTTFSTHRGYISEGGDLLVAEMTVAEAKIKATTLPECRGFTLRGEDSGGKVKIYFKNKWNVSGTGWTSFRLSRGDGGPFDPDSLCLDQLVIGHKSTLPPIKQADSEEEERCLWMSFCVHGSTWRWGPLEGSEEAKLERVEQQSNAEHFKALWDAHRRTCHDGPPVSLTFDNCTDSAQIEVCWLDRSGRRRSYGCMKPGGKHTQNTYVGHVWLLIHRSNNSSKGDGPAEPEPEEDAQSSSSEDDEARDERRKRWVESRAALGWLGTFEANLGQTNFRVDEAFLAEVKAKNAGAPVDSEEGQRGVSSLHEAHPLAFITPRYGGGSWICDHCRGQFSGASWHCAPCTFDLCAQCWAQTGEARPELPRLPLELLPKGSRARVAWAADGQRAAWVEDHNVHFLDFQASVEGSSVQPTALTTDGCAKDAYAARSLSWSPDGTSLAVLRVRVPERQRRLQFVESSPPGSVHSRVRKGKKYLKPGDPLPESRLIILGLGQTEAASPILTGVEGKLFPQPFTEDGLLRLQWTPDSREVCVDYVARDRQVFRVVACSCASGAERVILEERSEDPRRSFVDSTNDKRSWRWLRGGAEVLFQSERDGWCHLFVATAAGDGGVEPAEPRQLSKGQWVVRKVLKVDDDPPRRGVWFTACGCVRGHDPYFLHLCWVSLESDGQGVQVLTEDANGTHEVELSPCGRFFFDTWSRVDLPPVAQLRSAVDGKVILELERGDASALFASGYAPPVSFVAKGRDNETDIYGIIFFPPKTQQLAATPVVEEIYAGPHGAFCPKSWAQALGNHTARGLASDGFAVVQLDGMGTNHRGKSFLDVAWRALDDQGFEDRKKWLRALASAHRSLDISGGVGIYGGSAGGQAAMRALLSHGDLYRVAVADCGCHDNRLDKIWWNEQWMGPDIEGEWYQRCSNAAGAKGLADNQQLLLIVGELDDNVDPSTTMRVVGSLQHEGKHNFELCVIVGHGHGAADTPYGRERRRRFLLQHLMPQSRL